MKQGIKTTLQSLPFYKTTAIAAKEIKLIKTQKIAFVLILLYPLIVIGTLGAAFSGSGGIGKLDVAFYSPPNVGGFDTEKFIGKLSEVETINLLAYASEQEVYDSLKNRRAKIGVVVHEPEPVHGRYVIDLLIDNSNVVSAEFFFQMANNSVRRVGFDTSRELLAQIWANLETIKEQLFGEKTNLDSVILQLEESDKDLYELQRSVNEIDINEMREKLGNQKELIEDIEPKIGQFEDKVSNFRSLNSQKIQEIRSTRQTIADYKSQIEMTKQDIAQAKVRIEEVKAQASPDPWLEQAYARFIETESTINSAHSDLSDIENNIIKTENEMTSVQNELEDTSSNLASIKQDFGSASSDLNYFNSRLSALGGTVDNVNNLINKSIETKNKFKNDLESTKELIDGFTEKLSSLQALSPQFLSNPLVVNKIPLYNIGNLEAIAPAALVLLLLLTTVLLTGVSFVVERTEGAYSRLLLSSTGKLELFTGKILGQLVFALIESAIILGVAVFAFGIKIAGIQLWISTLGQVFSFTYLFALVQILIGIVIISVSFISLGLFISNYTKIQSTVILASLLLIIPMIFVSGMIIPIELMNPAIQSISSFQPLTLGMVLMTELLNKSTNLATLIYEIVLLIVPAIVFFVITLLNRNL